MHFPEPRNVKDVQMFLGLTGYFRKFIELYSIIAKPLTDLLQKNKPFNFNITEKEAFNKLKRLLSKDPVLNIFNSKLETEVHTDACRDGYGAILLQQHPDDHKLHPVYYFSRKTNPAERNYTSYELEALAVVRALEKFRHYLLGIKFKIVTDCAALKQTLDKTKPCPKIARWIMTLEEYDKIIIHRSGSRMRHVDALSRYPVMNIIENSIIVKIKEAQKNDSELKAIMKILEHKAYEDYLLRKGVLYKYKDGQELLVLPKSMYYEVIQMAHNKGHFSVKRTEENLKNDYYIPKLR